MSDAVRLDDIGVETGAAVRRRGRASSTATGVYDSLIITQDGLAVAPDAVEHTHVDVPPLSTLVKLTYGLPQFAMLPLTLVISIYGTTLYESCGASLSYVSFFQSLARSFDVMTDPLMGWISDNTRLAFGRRRPFMASGALFYAALFCLLMYPPIDQEGNLRLLRLVSARASRLRLARLTLLGVPHRQHDGILVRRQLHPLLRL